jgi:hypothetical protein
MLKKFFACITIAEYNGRLIFFEANYFQRIGIRKFSIFIRNRLFCGSKTG